MMAWVTAVWIDLVFFSSASKNHVCESGELNESLSLVQQDPTFNPLYVSWKQKSNQCVQNFDETQENDEADI